jgi:hypothetical protein
MKKLELVDNASEWKRWWSMRWIIAATVIESLRLGWPSIPPEWVSGLPTWIPQLLGLATLASLVGAGVSRVLKQPSKE